MTHMTGEGIAAILASTAGLVGVIGNIMIQLRGQNEARADRAEARAGRAALSDKVDVAAAKVDVTSAKIEAKVDANTELTKDTAAKVEVVHAATVAIAEATGSHPVLPHEGG
jgi:hypothetical protein